MDLDAGDFSKWLKAVRTAISDGSAMAVPCAGCTACCRSAQFVDIGPDEVGTLGHIPEGLRFPAPGRPGFQVLGYDEQGRCPMLGDAGCTIYEHRPRACRTFDCRIFAAAGVEPDEPGKELLAQQVKRWRFSYDTESQGAEHVALTRANRDGAVTSTEAALRAITNPRADRRAGL